jgi:rare lipoprotein A (peptidoglycan hydrolase)
MDLSKWAFEKIADTGAGVIGIRYRQVDCPDDTHTEAPCSHLSSCFGGK